ncbi:MAG: adenosylcobinamide-GDP ribazoletransferase [Chloroflexi bacterium]|nr:adenosylcobinamide-GDP ribazoletransferase [Chloroflexota bacterium]
MMLSRSQHPPARVPVPSTAEDIAAETQSGWRAWLLGPLFALQFLTVVPPLLRRAPRASEFGAADACFPLVGLMLGAGLYGLDLALAGHVTPFLRDVLLVLALATVTGALHLDGVVDTFDGAFAGRGIEQRLQIMRDPRAGAFGVVAVVGLLLLKVAALGGLNGPERALALCVGPCLGRWSILTATWGFPYARREGLGRAFKDAIRPIHVAVGTAIALAATVALAGPAGVLLVGGAAAAVLLVARLLVRRLGGLTGDTYGAICEIVETLVWLALGLRLGSA